MRRRRGLLWTCLALTGTALALWAADAPAALRLWFGLPMVVLIPGYALVAALDPRGRIAGAERLAISLGASISMTIVAGLLLSASPAGMSPVTWIAALGWLSVVTLLLALHRARLVPRTSEETRTRTAGWSGASAAVMVLVAGVVALAVVTKAAETPVGSEQSVERGRVSVLQLWALPGDTAGSNELVVGLENPGGKPVECLLKVTQGTVVLEERQLVLAPGYSGTVRVAHGDTAASVMFPVEVVLTNRAGDVVLRRLSVWPRLTTGRTQQTRETDG